MHSWFAISQRWPIPISVCLVAIATAIRVIMDPFISGAQFVFFYLAVIASTFLGGFTVGLSSVAMSFLSAWYFVIKPSSSFGLEPGSVLALVLFLITATLMAFMASSLQRAVRRIEAQHYHATLLDERVKAASELRLWKDIFDNIAMGVVVNATHSGKISVANRMYAQMHGMSPESTEGTLISDRYAAAERDRLGPLAALCDSVGHVSFEADRVRTDGSIFPARISVTSVRGTDGDVLYRIGSVTDITEERAHEMRWRDIFENVGIGVSVMDPATNTLRLVNKTYAKMHGWPQETLVGMSLLDLLAADDRSYVAGLLAVADQDGFASCEAERLRKDGSSFPVRLHATSVRGTDGTLLYRIGTVTDISAERENETRWRNVIDNAPFGLTLTGPGTDAISLSNRTFAELHGYEPAEVLGRSFFDFYAPAEHDRVSELRDIAERDGFVDFEADRLRRDGSIFPARVHVSSVSGPQGRPLYRIVSMFDITVEREQRLRYEAELRRWTDVINNSAFGICVVDPRTETISSSNPAFAALHGLTPDSLVGHSILSLYPAYERERAEAANRSADAQGQATVDVDRLRTDGSVFPARVHVTSVGGEDGTVAYRIISVRDVSGERALEVERQKSQRLEAMGQLTAGVSHDFNNLLQGMMSNLELLDDEIQDRPTARELAGSALRIADHAAELTRHLLSYSRQQVLRAVPLDLTGCLRDVVSTLARTLDPRIQVRLEVEPGIPPVLADVSHLHTAILNIAINARDAMPSGGELRIEATLGQLSNDAPEAGAPAAAAVVRISDTGIGIPQENLARVIEPFYSTKGLNDTGLGLSMVYGFTKQTGGDLRISSEVGQGTCVELWLPVVPAQAPAVMAAITQEGP
jgi:PAS domain S-box-containing protein